MPTVRPSKGSNKRSKKHSPVQFDDDSMVESIEADEPMDDAESADKVKDGTEALSDMSEEEMSQHLKLCMKLSVENKINMKNAFGLHLIQIMQKIVKKSERADIQQASLSLQASSKIYAGRVEALYQDTFRFHGHLQSIVSGGKKEKKNAQNDDDVDMDDDTSEKGKTKPQRNKCKSFLKSEESLCIEPEVSALATGQPHGNFVTINAAFSTSRLAPKLLSSLQLVDDSCMLRCAIPESCFKPRNPLQNVLYTVPPKLEGLLEKIKKISVSQAEFQSLVASTEANYTPNISTPKPVAPSLLFDDNDHFDPVDAGSNDSMMGPPSDPPADGPDLIDATIERFDILNITADAFVNDIAAAVTHNGIDRNLLPPNSALKKMLDRSKRTSVKPSVGKSTRKKTHEPFFVGRSANDIKHLFVKGRVLAISQKVLSEWNVEHTSNIDLEYEFIEELESKLEDESEDEVIELSRMLDIIKQNDLQYHFKYYFNKESQMWKIFRRKLSLNQSFQGTSFGNQTEKRLGSIAPHNSEVLALSFQNMSLHDSLGGSLHDFPADGGENTSDCEAPAGDIDEQQFLIPPEPFETDIEEMMVKPPELVRPTSVRFDMRPVNLNTEKIKDLLWLIISRRLELSNKSDEDFIPSVLFSEVYEELKFKLEREISEFISMQFAFVVLLILANQKTLLIENMEENNNLVIKHDICEIEMSENT